MGKSAKIRKEKRHQKIIRRKNFLPTLIIIIILWFITGMYIYFVDPFALGAVPVFFILLFFALLFTLSLILANTRRGFIMSLAIVIFLMLRYFEIGSIINLSLIVGISIAADIFFSSKT